MIRNPFCGAAKHLTGNTCEVYSGPEQNMGIYQKKDPRPKTAVKYV
jgi:hypothetical protein